MEIKDLEVTEEVKIKDTDALLVIDMQYDFLPGGALAVEDGDKIIDGINRIGKIFKEKKNIIVFTQDWHPEDHHSFASAHSGKDPGDEYSTEGIGPILWPDHCVQGTHGAEFHEDINNTLAHAIIRKGIDPKVDSYSGFRDKKKVAETGLKGYLRNHNVERVYIAGLALDYCCYYTAIDARDFNFEVNFIIDLTKGIDDPEGNVSKALKDMKDKGVKFVKESSF